MHLLNKICFTLIALFTFASLLTGQQDVKGSEDHSLISRYPGSIIKWYNVEEYNRYKIAAGPVTGYRHIDEWISVEGKVTRIYYSLKGNRSVTEVYLNYQKALKKNGFEIIADGFNKDRNVGKKIGERGWLQVYFAENPVPSEAPLLQGSSTVGGSAFTAGKLSKNGATIYLAISLAQYKSDEVLYIIDIIEEEAVEDDFIFVNAELMKNEIEANGKIAIYGIYFDTDKSTLKPESEPTFKEIVKLLNDNPDLNIFVVGHTDMTGTFSHNLKLSKDRAAAVVEELTNKYKVSKKRLTADGVGPLAPAAANINEEGRKKNRRVELVGML
jgi:outer membrane protein OmpA-like peptidoglycan-associated protein